MCYEHNHFVTIKYNYVTCYHIMKHINTHKTYDSAKELLSNLQSARNKRLVCDVCGKTFTNHGCLQMYSKIHAGVKEFKCQDCGKMFVRKEHLVVHVRTYSGVRLYYCDICGKEFSQSTNLQVHRQVHTGQRPDCCSSWGQLKIHTKRFSGEKPYACNICDLFFLLEETTDSSLECTVSRVTSTWRETPGSDHMVDGF